MAAISALAPPQPPDGPGPFALSEPGLLESTLEAAGLGPVESGEVPVQVKYPEPQTACRALMASGMSVRAIQHSGEERVRRAILEALDAFRTDTGSYRIQNRFRLVIAT
jgi:hypothetical protein